MKRFIFQMSLILALIFAGICLTSTSFAGKPDRDGGKKGGNHKQEKKSENYRDHKNPAHGTYDGKHKQEAKNGNYRDRRASEHGTYDGRNGHGASRGNYFNEQRQRNIHHYYSEQYRRGHCPPGLVKQGHRCIPRGHAKNWRRGQRLPREVIFYDLPPTILVQLGPPPPMHRFVRVAQDILLIAVGTGMVVDAFEDIGQ